MLRSPLSGVPQELGAAYAALSLREGSVVELLDRQRLAAGAETREMILEFRRALRDLAQIPATASDEERGCRALRHRLTAARKRRAAPIRWREVRAERAGRSRARGGH